MRKFNNYEAVKVNNAEEAMEFLQYLEDNTDLKWFFGEKPTWFNEVLLSRKKFPFFIEAFLNQLFFLDLDALEDETKIIPLSEFLEPKVTYTREQAEAVFRDASLFHNNNKVVPLNSLILEFLDHKFPKSTLEQVTEAVKDLGNFTIEQTSTGAIIISPINK